MKTYEEQTIDAFAQRSEKAVYVHATFLAVMPTVLMLMMLLMTVSRKSALPNYSIVLVMPWAPLCYMTIPPIYFLCRRVKQLEARLQEITKSQSVHESA